MNKEEFFKWFHDELYPKPLWELDGPKREGQKDPIFRLRAYSVRGSVVIMQEHEGNNGFSFYLPDMNNDWAETKRMIEAVADNKKPYAT